MMSRILLPLRRAACTATRLRTVTLPASFEDVVTDHVLESAVERQCQSPARVLRELLKAR